jgi:hypothetical protein
MCAVLRAAADCGDGQAVVESGSGTSPLPRVPPGGGAVDRPERRAVRRERDGRDDSM